MARVIVSYQLVFDNMTTDQLREQMNQLDGGEGEGITPENVKAADVIEFYIDGYFEGQDVQVSTNSIYQEG